MLINAINKNITGFFIKNENTPKYL